MRLLRKILATGRVTEPAPPAPEPAPEGLPASLRGSLQLRHVDAGSCNGCEIEIGGCFGPVYDAERLGVRLVASPRHADGLIVTGPVTRNMATPLAKTWEATPHPKVVVAVGDCALGCGAFEGGYGVVGGVEEVLAVDVRVAGCPPDPAAILAALRQVTG
jgi:Ni,Fe-hydrogenase III small subunit